MYDSFFRILTSDKSYENEYVMRAVMRLSSALYDGILPYLNQLIDKLVMILRRSIKVKIKIQNYFFVLINLFFRIQINQILIIIYSKQ